MKKQFIKSANLIFKDRYLAVLLASFLLLCLIIVIYLGFSVHASELQIVVHYTSFGTTNFYRDKWYYLLSFVAFIILMAIAHSLLTFRLLQKKGRELAIAFVWLSIVTVLIAVSIFYQVLKIASLS
jgi:hypothetical protein